MVRGPGGARTSENSKKVAAREIKIIKLLQAIILNQSYFKHLCVTKLLVCSVTFFAARHMALLTKSLVVFNFMSINIDVNAMPKNKTIHVIAVSYLKFGELKVFVQSWINQSRDNWILSVIHDGPNLEFDLIMEGYRAQSPININYSSTQIRFNDYGHSLREIGLQDVKGDYVLLTNADNYFIPRAVEFMNDAISLFADADVIMFDMVHSHEFPEIPGRPFLPSYSHFKTEYKPGYIDVSSAIVKAELASAAGFRDKGHDGDAVYFMDVANAKITPPLLVAKSNRIIFVHN